MGKDFNRPLKKDDFFSDISDQDTDSESKSTTSALLKFLEVLDGFYTFSSSKLSGSIIIGQLVEKALLIDSILYSKAFGTQVSKVQIEKKKPLMPLSPPNIINNIRGILPRKSRSPEIVFFSFLPFFPQKIRQVNHLSNHALNCPNLKHFGGRLFVSFINE